MYVLWEPSGTVRLDLEGWLGVWRAREKEEGVSLVGNWVTRVEREESSWLIHDINDERLHLMTQVTELQTKQA